MDLSALASRRILHNAMNASGNFTLPGSTLPKPALASQRVESFRESVYWSFLPTCFPNQPH